MTGILLKKNSHQISLKSNTWFLIFQSKSGYLDYSNHDNFRFCHLEGLHFSLSLCCQTWSFQPNPQFSINIPWTRKSEVLIIVVAATLLARKNQRRRLSDFFWWGSSTVHIARLITLSWYICWVNLAGFQMLGWSNCSQTSMLHLLSFALERTV